MRLIVKVVGGSFIIVQVLHYGPNSSQSSKKGAELPFLWYNGMVKD